MDNFRVGHKITTQQGYEITITEVHTTRRCNIKFENGFELIDVDRTTFENHNVKYPFHPTVHGKGYLGVGKYNSTATHIGGVTRERELHPAYRVWQGMLGRCYCPKVHKRQPNFRNLTVCDKWLNYQEFARWFEDNYVFGFDFSQNILKPNSRIFSPETCCFVPNEIRNTLKFLHEKKNNNLPIGVSENNFFKYKARYRSVSRHEILGSFDTPEEAFLEYKKTKENHIKDMAEKWKPELKPNTYDALMNFEIIDYYQIK
jgi:hypothetical protein